MKLLICPSHVNASDMSVNTQININERMDSKCKVRYNFVTLCLTFKWLYSNKIPLALKVEWTPQKEFAQQPHHLFNLSHKIVVLSLYVFSISMVTQFFKLCDQLTFIAK